MDLDIDVNEAGDRVTASGELDAVTGPRVRTTVLDMLADATSPAPTDTPPPSTRRVLDLSGISFVASAGLALLLELDARASAASLNLVLIVDPNGVLSRMLKRTGLTDQLSVEAPSDVE